MGHASDDNSFRILVDTLQNLVNKGVLTTVATGVDANTKVLPGKDSTSFTQLLEEIYKAAPGQTFEVSEIKQIINAITGSKSGKTGQSLVKPIVDEFLRLRSNGGLAVPVEPEMKPGAVAQEVMENVVETPATVEVKPALNAKELNQKAFNETKDIVKNITDEKSAVDAITESVKRLKQLTNENKQDTEEYIIEQRKLGTILSNP